MNAFYNHVLSRFEGGRMAAYVVVVVLAAAVAVV
jgi:hypothetical protein